MSREFLVIPETFEPTLLVQRAKRLRHKTKNWALHAKAEGHEACVQKRIDETCIQCDKQKNGFLQEHLKRTQDGMAAWEHCHLLLLFVVSFALV
jgi:hypothetical protein